MSVDERVARRFLEDHPEDSARVLEALPVESARDLFAGASASTAAPVLDAMVSANAARVLKALPEDAASEILARLSPGRASEVLRLLEEDARKKCLEHMPEEPRRAVERLLRFPAGTAGALMEPRVAACHVSRSASEALDEIRNSGVELRYYVYVVDDGNVLRGAVSIRELLSAAPDAPLSAVMREPAESLPARAEARGILAHPGWRRLPVLPVVDGKNRLVGIFRYETLQALRGGGSDAEGESPIGLALALGELFWMGASSLVRGLERK